MKDHPFGNVVARLDLKEFSFNAFPRGPALFGDLVATNYGKNFRMATLPEITSILYVSLENHDWGLAQQIISSFDNKWVVGNTGILWTEKGLYIQDFPELKNGQPFMQEQTLESKLSDLTEGGVRFSEDRKIRFVQYGFKTEVQTAEEIRCNPGVIALFAGKENAEKIARASEYYKLNPFVWAGKERVKTPQVMVGGLLSAGSGGLQISTEGKLSCKSRYSFGVLEK